MVYVPRHVRLVQERDTAPSENPSRPLEDFREQTAWVLLGEPGAGKSSAFEAEAEATGGVFIPIAEFLSVLNIGTPDPEWRGKTLFLDGLDETRAGGGADNILLQVRAHLRKLGKPSFRITCRAADWFGSTDREAIDDASPDGQLMVLLLEPLDESEIIEILRENHGIADPQDFIGMARKRGVEGLLDNPQTLKLLAESVQDDDGQLPETREETYRLSCEHLAREDSKRHRIRQGTRQIPVDQMLDAAGQLCAMLLLSDKSGFALDRESADGNFPLIDDFAPPDPSIARDAARRKLFRPPSGKAEERLVPTHRSVAEYLAARWLAHRIDDDGLPLGRVLNLLLGIDGRTVAGLRGLYGWLALHCRQARARLIDADPLTVVVYGDVKPMSSGDKRRVLEGLRREAERHAAFRWEARTEAPFGALADAGLVGDFIAALESPDRTEAAQSYADCVLTIIAEGDALPALATTLRNVVVDDTRWRRVREGALQAWLKQGASTEEAVTLLDAIANGQVIDGDDELSGQLLHHLYPAAIEPVDLLRYLHVPKDRNFIGAYARFWGRNLPHDAPASHLPALLDGLAARTDLPEPDPRELYLRRMIGSLLARGIETLADDVSDERLFSWLGLGIDKFGHFQREKKERERIVEWLSRHPTRYKRLLALCYRRCEGAENPRGCIWKQQRRLHGAPPPEDIGRWHLEQVSRTVNDDLAENHLSEAVCAVMNRRGDLGLDLEQIEAWADAHPERKDWLGRMLVCEIRPSQIEDAALTKAAEQERLDRRRERTISLGKHLDAIRNGAANAALMYELAGIWLDHYVDTHGETVLERFDSYCDDGPTVLGAAEEGFRLCPERADLPTVADIIKTHLQGKEHLIRQPCLVGMKLRWQDGADRVPALPEDKLSRMIAFLLTSGIDDTGAWFVDVITGYPALVAEVLVEYASATLAARHDYVEGIYPLAHDPAYSAVARIAVPELLERFPVRSKAGQLDGLGYLLKAALRYNRDRLPALLEKKISAKSMGVAQKVYWLTTAMLFDPEKYERVLWNYVGNSSNRANYVSGFLSERFIGLKDDYELSAHTLGKLIELLVPHAELDWPKGGGRVNEGMRRGDHIRSMVTRLGTLGTEDAVRELERLLRLPALNKLKFSLEDSLHQLRLRQRENAFRFPSLAGVAKILANREPTSAADLAALALDHLDDLAQEIGGGNRDLFRQFWTEHGGKGQPGRPKPENSCRDVVLEKLSAQLAPHGVVCDPERDHRNDKRADIGLSYGTEIRLPIEIKGEWNDALWTGLRRQLIEQYSIDPGAQGYGIYLVLWFGGERQSKPGDAGKKPRSAEELRVRLENQLAPEERSRIFVRVLDVSWPRKA